MRYICLMVLLTLVVRGASAHADEVKFQQWLTGFKQYAVDQGISPAFTETVFVGVTENPKVIALDQKQPENKINLQHYLNNLVTKKRVHTGREMMREHHDLLTKISRTYGVQPKYIVALWGIESNYGQLKGRHSLVESLATLAYEGRRSEFFSKELLVALKIMEDENLTPEEFTGSWAGAMGQCQFMPTTYYKHAADGDGDGHRDIWNNEADVFASIASYLNALGWDDNEEWGGAVRFPKGFRQAEADITVGESATHWRKRGLKYKDGGEIASDDLVLYAIYPGTTEEGALLVTNNYKLLLEWNRSRYFATAVGQLADAIGASE